MRRPGRTYLLDVAKPLSGGTVPAHTLTVLENVTVTFAAHGPVIRFRLMVSSCESRGAWASEDYVPAALLPPPHNGR